MLSDTRTVAAEPVDSPEATALLWTYEAEMIGRYVGRPATDAEVDRELAEDPNDGLAPPTGTFLVLRDDGSPVGCVGVRFAVDGPATAELKRLFVVPGQRGTGAGRRLVAAAEDAASASGARTLRLDTRHDLVEACALYEACGFAEVPAFNAGPYAQRWYAKEL